MAPFTVGHDLGHLLSDPPFQEGPVTSPYKNAPTPIQLHGELEVTDK